MWLLDRVQTCLPERVGRRAPLVALAVAIGVVASVAALAVPAGAVEAGPVVAV